MIVAVLVTGILTPTQATQAAVYSWMRTAKTMYLNRTINGTARNNVKPTLMDPYDCYDDYFYVKIPARMELYLSISVEELLRLILSEFIITVEMKSVLCTVDGLITEAQIDVISR